MRTRVVKSFSLKHGINVYYVHKWALWDAPDLRQYYPNDYDWRFVDTFKDEQEAKDFAYRLASGCEPDGVIAEFGID